MIMAIGPSAGHIAMIMNVTFAHRIGRGDYDRGGSSTVVMSKSTGQISTQADAGTRPGNLPCVV